MEKRQPTEKIMECSKHGEFTSKGMPIAGRMIWTQCPVCYEQQELRRQGEVNTEIPWLSKRCSKMSLQSYDCKTEKQENIYKRCCGYVKNFEKVKEMGICLSFLGNPGTGKTHLAISIGIAITNQGYSVSYERSYDLMCRIKNSYDKTVRDTEEEIMKRLSVFDLLILDEVGLKKLSDTEKVLIYQIIDKRYEDVKPTIIISNLNETELADNIGARTVDRLYENKGVIFSFDWDSNRRV